MRVDDRWPYEAVRNLLGLYCELIDAGDFGGVAELLSAAVLCDESGAEVARGREGIAALYAAATRRFPDGTPRTRHLTTNSIIEVDEVAGTATARSSYVVLQATDSLPLQPIVAGRYHDRFARTPAGWVFTERKIVIDLTGNLADHLTFQLP